MGVTMKNKWMIVLAGAGAAVLLFFGGMFAVNTVFAAEQKAAMESGMSGTQLHALTGMEAKKAYKKEVYGDIGCTVVLPDGYVPSEDKKACICRSATLWILPIFIIPHRKMWTGKRWTRCLVRMNIKSGWKKN